MHLERLDPAIDQGVNVADVFFHLLDKLKRLIAFGPHFGDAPLGLLQRILKLSDAIRLRHLLWHVIGFLPGEASGRVKYSRRKTYGGAHRIERGPALGVWCTVRRGPGRAAERPD